MRSVDGAQGARMHVDGREVWHFAGSNYLDLALHPDVVEASRRASARAGCAAGGSRLISGNTSLHEALEHELAGFLGTESALAFNTGYMANLGVIPALVGPGDVVVSDALCHASIIDGCRLSRADVRVFDHGSVESLEDTLCAVGGEYRRVLVALDGLYSMDGDLAPLEEMIPLARRHGALTLVDDAHGTGTLGANGRGTPERAGISAEIDVWMGTLGKSVGSFGAFVAGERALRELLVNTARSFIFSCALAPPQVEASRAALRVIRAEPWRRERLQELGERLRKRLAAHGVDTRPSTSHIVPVVVGENEPTMALCERLLEQGFYAQGIRHPSVPRGSARLRITLMCSHPDEAVDALADAVAEGLAA